MYSNWAPRPHAHAAECAECASLRPAWGGVPLERGVLYVPQHIAHSSGCLHQVRSVNDGSATSRDWLPGSGTSLVGAYLVTVKTTSSAIFDPASSVCFWVKTLTQTGSKRCVYLRAILKPKMDEKSPCSHCALCTLFFYVHFFFCYKSSYARLNDPMKKMSTFAV